MTIIELLDNKPINNVIGALAFKPDKIIYVGGMKGSQFDLRVLPSLRRYFRLKDLDNTVIEYVQVRRDDLNDIIEKLDQVYLENSGCRFHIEVTGGEDLMLVAIGVLLGLHPDMELVRISKRLLSIHTFSLNGTKDMFESAPARCSNSVRENIVLHGASVLKANGSDILRGGWRFSDGFKSMINSLWKILCRGIPGFDLKKYYPNAAVSYPNMWNRITGVIGALDRYSSQRENTCIIRVPETFYADVANRLCKVSVADSYIDEISSLGLLKINKRDGFITIEFKDEQVRGCLTKSGILLELKTYLMCRELLSDCNSDVLTGVTIDWDGKTGKSDNGLYSDTANTVNEVDVMATFGLIPYFISCKNGKFSSDELYKLSSVANRFGIGYSYKIIVTTDIQYALNDMGHILLQRASDMGIRVIDNVHEMSDNEFSEALEAAMELPKGIRDSRL